LTVRTSFCYFLTMKKSFLFCVFSLLVLCGSSYGFDIKGLQPLDPYGVFSTFSAESLAKGKVAFSAGGEMSVHPDFYRVMLKTAYGLSDKVELEFSVPYEFGSGTPDGFEDISLGLKHRFFDEGKYGPSLAYLLIASPPTGAEGLTTEGRYGAGLIVSKRVGPFNGHANFFYVKPGKSSLEDEISFLTGVDFAAAHNFKILAELFCRKSHFSKKVDTIEGRAGYRIMTTDSIYTTLGIGTDFKKRDPETRVLLTVTFVSPREKKKIKKIYEEE
jgi:hypothetical protein